MFRDLQEQTSGVGIALFVGCAAAGAMATALLNHVAPVIVGGLVGVYFMFAIKVVRQWEKVAVLRFGRYVGLADGGCSLSFRL